MANKHKDEMDQPATKKKIVFPEGVDRVNMPFFPHSQIKELLMKELENMYEYYSFPEKCAYGVIFEIHLDKNPKFSYTTAAVYVEK